VLQHGARQLENDTQSFPLMLTVIKQYNTIQNPFIAIGYILVTTDI